LVGEGLGSEMPSPVRGLTPAATLSRGAGEGLKTRYAGIPGSQIGAALLG